MPYNQIAIDGTIISGENPNNFTAVQIKDQIFQALNKKDYEFTWKEKKSQPYRGSFNDGNTTIDLYVYAWNMTPAYRRNPSEKRIQIQAAVNNVGIDRPITATEKTIIIGLYNSPVGGPLFAAWDTTVNRGHGQKSCYVQIEDVAQALTKGIYKTEDRNGASIFTMTADFLGDYVSLLAANNALNVGNGTETLAKRVGRATESNRKTRTIRSAQKLKDLIASLSSTEQKTIQKSRIGQGYFRELLINKYGCKCALCDISTEAMLRASHIKEWGESTDDEKLDDNNGLLLCVHHDALFDKHMISFEDDGTLLVSTSLSADEKRTLGIDSIPNIDVLDEMKPYLAIHRRKIRR